MTSQGVCPEPTCMSPEAIGLSGSNSFNSSSSNAGLIGGLVGGLVGGGALLGCLGYIFIRHKQKKNAIPLALKRAVVNNSSKRNMTPRQQEEMMHTSQQVIIKVYTSHFNFFCLCLVKSDFRSDTRYIRT